MSALAKASRRCASYTLSAFDRLIGDCVLVGEAARTLWMMTSSWARCDTSGACDRVRAKIFGATVVSLYEAPTGWMEARALLSLSLGTLASVRR